MNNSNPASAPTGRTVYVGSLPADAAVDELLSQVRFGPIDNVKILPEKNCAFISFLDPTTAAAFHSDALMRKIQLHGQELKIGWGKPSTVSTTVIVACQQNGATRNVYLGNLDESVTEQSLRDDLSRFGPIDQVKVVRDKNIAFVHFLSIATAIKVVQQLAQEPEWAGRKVNYGEPVAIRGSSRSLTSVSQARIAARTCPRTSTNSSSTTWPPRPWRRPRPATSGSATASMASGWTRARSSPATGPSTSATSTPTRRSRRSATRSGAASCNRSGTSRTST